MLITILIIIAIVIILNMRGKRIWKNNIKFALLALPVDKIQKNIIKLAKDKNHDSCELPENLCLSSIEILLMYIVVKTKGRQNLNAIFRDMRNVLSIISHDDVLTMMMYAVYSRICAMSVSLGTVTSYDRLPINQYVAILLEFRIKLDNIGSEDYFGNVQAII